MRNQRVQSRQEMILRELSKEKQIQVSDLLRILNVSDETLRKDLIALEDKGVILRQHGSASLIIKGGEERMSVRQFSEIPAKYRIAEEALKLIPDGAAIGLDASNTVYFLSRLLAERTGYTIVTNALDSASAFSDGNGANSVYSTGGLMRDMDRAFYGPTTLYNIGKMMLSIAFLGTAGLKNTNGIGAVSFDDRGVKKALRSVSEVTVALFDSTKFEKSVLMEALSWNDIDIVITDNRISDADKKIIENQTTLILV